MDQASELRNLVLNQKLNNKFDFNSKLITITSGKGGVGKSNFSLNLALYFNSIAKKVLVIDADFGCANIEVLFGIVPQYSFQHIIKGQKNISEVIIDTKYGIKFISGGSGFKDLSNLTESQVNYFIEQFEYLDNLFDIIIIDTGSGISRNVTSFAKASNEIIIVTTPEPTSFTDSYAFMKVISSGNNNINLPSINLVVNKSEDYFEANTVYNKLSNAARKFLNIEIQNLGHIPLDDNLIRAVKQQHPIILSYPNSKFSIHIRKIGDKLINNNINQSELEIKDTSVKTFMKRLVSIFNK